jgi:hypothetical protein
VDAQSSDPSAYGQRASDVKVGVGSDEAPRGLRVLDRGDVGDQLAHVMSVAAEAQSAPFRAETSGPCLVSELAPGAIIRFQDGTYGVVMSASGGTGVGVDLWHEAAALVPFDEFVEVVCGA